MLNKVIQILLFAGLLYSQQQVDIPWPTLANSDWPMVKHDPQFTGRSPFKGPQTPNIAWIKDMPHGIFSGPVIGENGNLFFGSYYIYADTFYSYNPDGKLVWEFETGGNRAPESGILINSSNTIYFGSRDSNLYALNFDGTLKWKYTTSGFITESSILNIDLVGNIYVTNFIFEPSEPDRGELYSIKSDGTLNWKVMYDNGFAFKSPVFSPDGNTIYIAGIDSNLFALNLDGSIKWKFSCGDIEKAPLVDSDGNIYFMPTELPQYFYSLKPDGTIRWQFTIQNPSRMYTIPTIDYSGNIYYIGYDSTCCTYLSLISLDYDGELRWSYLLDELDPFAGTDDFWQPLICDSEGTVYVGSTFGYYYYAISSEGKLRWLLPLTEIEQQVDNTGAISKDGTLYLGVHNIAVFTGHKKTLMAIRDTGATSVNSEYLVLTDYSLSQNYPNPFNPSTKIKYQLPESGIVTIKVYDILGNEIATLINEQKPAGEYEVEFNGSKLTSGIYFYQLKADNFISTKKMIVLK